MSRGNASDVERDSATPEQMAEVHSVLVKAVPRLTSQLAVEVSANQGALRRIMPGFLGCEPWHNPEQFLPRRLKIGEAVSVFKTFNIITDEQLRLCRWPQFERNVDLETVVPYDRATLERCYVANELYGDWWRLVFIAPGMSLEHLRQFYFAADRSKRQPPFNLPAAWNVPSSTVDEVPPRAGYHLINLRPLLQSMRGVRYADSRRQLIWGVDRQLTIFPVAVVVQAILACASIEQRKFHLDGFHQGSARSHFGSSEVDVMVGFSWTTGLCINPLDRSEPSCGVCLGYRQQS